MLSGCALIPTKTVVLGGVRDIVEVNAGSKVCDVKLPTDEKKTYCIVTEKPSVLVSLDAWNRAQKG